MARFQFKYQSILKHRCAVEDARQRELALHLRHRMILQNELTGMQRTIVDSKRHLGVALTGNVDMAQVARFARYSGQTAQRAHAILLKLAQGEKQIDQSRNLLAEATRQRKAIELLQDRYRRQWRREQDRRETEVLDELALQAYTRKTAVEQMS